MLAHDLNNHLNVILGRCDLLRRILEDNSDAARHVDSIAEAARRIAAMVAERKPHPPSVRRANHD
jgi:nitrogen-specific signal transduction histidine kinase